MIELIRKIVSKVYNAELLQQLSELITGTCAVSSAEDNENLAREIRACLSDIKVMSPYYRIYLLSVLCGIENNRDDIVQMIQCTVDATDLSKETKYFLIRQYDRIAFVRPEMWSKKAGAAIQALYDQVYENYKKGLEGMLKPIPKEERNRDLIVIFTTQFLGERHAPTHSTMERCYSLGKLMNKQVLLINTREVLTTLGWMPFFRYTEANLLEVYNNINSVTYKDYTMEFFQPEMPMPDVNMIQVILAMVAELKPWFVLGLGDYSITADLCSNIVPEAALSFGFSALPATQGQMSILGRQLFDGELERYMESGFREDKIIESTFTFELHAQKKHFTRKDLGIPEDKFALVTIGTRLHDDITDEFVEHILGTTEWGTHFVIVGNMDTYEQMCERHEELREHSTFLGYQDDVLAVLENCDLYVNPRRIGGGFSIVEGFNMNIPGVTIAYGDIAAAAGKDFWVKDYDEMFATVKRYMEDKVFYQSQVERAQERVKVLLDGKTAMEKIVEKIESNSSFF